MLSSNTTKIATIMTKKNQIKLELDKKKKHFYFVCFCVENTYKPEKKKFLMIRDMLLR